MDTLHVFGTNEAVPPPRLLTAGALSAEFIDGNLRNIRIGDIEVLRAISYVVRDKDWGTYVPRIDDVVLEPRPDGFSLRYAAVCEGADGGRLMCHALITGDASGLRFEVEGVPERDLLTNRCGFTVLHPVVGLAGRPVEVEHVDGSVERAPLPDLIDPWQPFKDMRAIIHEVVPGVFATCRMEGDAFEMEDQRNWSDASYKTYVRPLALPWPYTLPAGEPVRQSVALSIRGGAPAVIGRAQAAVRIEIGAQAGRMPAIGLVVTPEEAAATLACTDALTEVGPQSLLLHFDPTAGHGLPALRALAQVAARHRGEIVLECVVPGVAAPAEELQEVARQAAAAGLRLDAIAVSPAADRRSTPPGSAWPACPPLEEVYAAARAAFPGVVLGGGMFSYFTELNRKRPPAHLLDFVTHCTCPLVHDADDRSVMQTLEALPFIARSTRAIIGEGKPYRIGPSTLGMRQNPYGSRTLPNPQRRRMTMTADDPRQDGTFAAAWMVGYAARLVPAGVACFTVGAMTGPFGLIGPAGRRPVFAAARSLAALGGAAALACLSSAEDRVLALAAMRADGGRVLLAANLTAGEQVLELSGGGQVRLMPYDIKEIDF
ncbi:MAG TPA: hypothetical protein VLA00_12450 [Xanthobacteraceae bacterium]|nr:hypothetical protein [Xanthobacteraceae bacterium]